MRRRCRADRCTNLYRAMGAKIQGSAREEVTNFQHSLFQESAKAAAAAAIRLPRVQKNKRRIRKRTTGCPKDKIPPLVSSPVAKCQGLGKFSSVQVGEANSHAFDHYLPLALLQCLPPPRPTACAPAGPVQEPVREQLSVPWSAQQLLAPEAVGMPRWS